MKISMKKRKIGYTYGSVSGHFAFRKQKSIAFESTLERDMITLLEFNDSVSNVIEQPVTIEYINHNNRVVTYTPDFLVHFNEPNASLIKLDRKPLLIEVKPRDKLISDWDKLKAKFKIGIKYAKDNDMIFKIYDESRIRTPYLKNILFLKRYQKLTYKIEDTDMILSLLNSVGSSSIEYILEYLTTNKDQKGLLLSVIWYLIANKKILCKLDKALNTQTNIWINDNIEMSSNSGQE
ncbi:MAG: heteromeric transposase endonuclease subunit TnsA [Epsilonproteobacteria bacterium]|nr:MAG: heteromeric transposase endonuclease subunit TnsA [Campylobacterota bacterium]